MLGSVRFVSLQGCRCDTAKEKERQWPPPLLEVTQNGQETHNHRALELFAVG